MPLLYANNAFVTPIYFLPSLRLPVCHSHSTTL